MDYEQFTFKAASLLQCYDKWRTISAPDFVLDIIKSGVTIPFNACPEPFNFRNPTFSASQKQFLDKEIPRLVKLEVISQVSTKPKWLSPLTCVPKKDSQWRLCLNLKHLNQFINTPRFSCENIDTLSSYIQYGDKLVTCDLESGFLHVQMLKQHRQFLGFAYKGRYYVYNTLVFGLSCAPFFFHKLLRPVVGFLRDVYNLRVCLYVDDWLLMAQDCLIKDHTDTLVHTLQDLGLYINFVKSDLCPSNQKEYIGFVINSEGPNGCPWIVIPRKKITKLKSCIRVALGKDYISARALARICGLCVSMCKAIIPAKLKLRNAYRLLASRKSWADLLYFTPAARKDLHWWFAALAGWNGAPIQIRTPQLQIATDASQSGWGGIILNSEIDGQIGQSASGLWPESIAHEPSNYRELLAIILTLDAFKGMVTDKCVRILSDNISAVAYLNHMGGPSTALSELAQSLWAQCFEMKIQISAKYLAGKLNIQADYLSRLTNQYEWRLHPRLFRMIDQVFGPHTVDRFSSITTTHLRRYNSQFHDPASEAVDALAQSWVGEMNFVNPPFRLIPKILTLIQQQKVEATIIAPWWPAQPWFKTLQRLSISNPLRLPHSIRTFIPMVPVCPEPLKNKQWRIFAWKISGKNC